MDKLIFILCFLISSEFFAQNREDNFKASYLEESKKNYRKAIEYIEKDAALEQCYECNFRLGWLYYLHADYVKSIQFYRYALQLQEGSIEALYGLTYPYSVLKQWENIANTYNDILRISPTQINALYYLGLIHYYNKEYKKAKENCQKILNLYPTNYYTNLFMGDIHTAEGDAAKAKEYYQLAAIYEMAKENAEKSAGENCYACYLRLGWLAYEDKNYQNSIEHYGRAEGIVPNSLEPYYGKTYSYAAVKDVRKLKDLYGKIVSLDPHNTYALYSLAYYQFEDSEYDQAEKNCLKVLTLFPFDYYTNQLMANIKLKQDKGDEAGTYLERALVYNPNENITKTRLQKLGKR